MWRAFKSSLLLSEPSAFLSAALNLLSLMVHLADLNSSVVTTPSESTSNLSINGCLAKALVDKNVNSKTMLNLVIFVAP
jgi:hypothetical protein